MTNEILTLVGVALGAGLGLLTQQVLSRTNDRRTLRENLRRERIDAYCALGGTLRAYRRAQMVRWHAERTGEGSADEARASVHRARDLAGEALFRVQLLAVAPEVRQAADLAFWDMDAFRNAESQSGFEQVQNRTLARIEDFREKARKELEPRVGVALSGRG